MYTKVAELAERFRVSADTVYLWVRSGVIPSDCVDRVGATIRIDAERFERLLKSGGLYRPRGRKSTKLPERTHPEIGEDSYTTQRTGITYDHRWVRGDRNVGDEHPWSPPAQNAE